MRPPRGSCAPRAASSGRSRTKAAAVLPGVTVTATSPALQVASVTAVTDANGEYRLTPLPIGTYTVEYTLSGFRTLRHDEIRLTVGFTARVDVVLKVGAVEESVTVTGQSPLIDTTVAATATQVTRENLENIPTGRNGYIGLMQFTPGTRPPLDVGGSSNNQNPSFRAFGQSDQAWQIDRRRHDQQPANRRQRQLLRLHGVRGGDGRNHRPRCLHRRARRDGDHRHQERRQRDPRQRVRRRDEQHVRVGARGRIGRRRNLDIREDFNGEIGGKIIAEQAVVLVRRALPAERGQRPRVPQAGRDTLRADEPEHLLHAEAHLSDER